MLVKMLSPSIMLKKGILIVGLGFLVISLSLDSSFARAGSSFDRLLQAVVRIDVRETTFLGGSARLVSGVGSGVIMSRDGPLMTNAHVVSPQAVDIWVTLASLERAKAILSCSLLERRKPRCLESL